MATVQSMTLMLPASQPTQPSQTTDAPGDRSDKEFGRFVQDAQQASETAQDTRPTDGETTPTEAESETPVPVLSQGRIQHRGGLELVVGESEISPESLVEFMRSQGFSVGDAKQVLGLEQGLHPFNAEGLQTSQTPQVLKRGQGLSLSQALLNQLISPETSDDTFFIHEIVVAKQAFGEWTRWLEQPTRAQQMMSDVLEVFDEGVLSDAQRGALIGSSMNASEGESNSFSQSSPFARQLELHSTQSTTQNSDFRSMIADFLKRSDSLQQLADRMGQMMAARMAGHLGRGQWSLEMALHPAELGRIEIDMEMTDRGLEAQFRTTQSVTRDLLVESMPRLKAWFEEGGINVASTLVDMGFQRHHGENPTARDDAQRSKSPAGDEVVDPVADHSAIGEGQRGLNILV